MSHLISECFPRSYVMRFDIEVKPVQPIDINGSCFSATGNISLDNKSEAQRNERKGMFTFYSNYTSH